MLLPTPSLISHLFFEDLQSSGCQVRKRRKATPLLGLMAEKCPSFSEMLAQLCFQQNSSLATLSLFLPANTRTYMATRFLFQQTHAATHSSTQSLFYTLFFLQTHACMHTITHSLFQQTYVVTLSLFHTLLLPHSSFFLQTNIRLWPHIPSSNKLKQPHTPSFLQQQGSLLATLIHFEEGKCGRESLWPCEFAGRGNVGYVCRVFAGRKRESVTREEFC